MGRYDRAAVTERERDTRWRRIDPKLRASGWAIADAAGVNPAELTAPKALTEFATHGGPADYTLCADDRVLGVVEAKNLSTGSTCAAFVRPVLM